MGFYELKDYEACESDGEPGSLIFFFDELSYIFTHTTEGALRDFLDFLDLTVFM